MPMRRAALFVLFAALSTPAAAQLFVPTTFTPNPAPQGSNVRMSFTMLGPTCGQPTPTSIVRTGSAIRIDYLVLSEGFICLATPPPFSDAVMDIGSFPPGQYVVTAFGFDPAFQNTIPPVTGVLGVFPASNVPTLSRTAALLFALAALLAGMARLLRRARMR